MYLSHFGLNQSPFGITPNPAFFYAGNKRGAILEALIYAVTHGEGIIKVTGEVGSGKTMLCRMLESNLPPHIEVIYLVNPTLSREEVVYAIAGELDLATGGKRPDEVIRLLQNDLIAKHVAGKQIVLLVEEAQAMPLDTLEEIRLFSNLETAHHKLLQIVLFGQPELDDNLRLPRMRQLKERITHSFQVPPMEPAIIPEFLMFRMRAAGYRGPDVFTKGAIRQLAAVSEGIVRRISILADKSLLAAFADNTHAIQAKHVKAAILDSEFSTTAAASSRRKWLLVLLALTGIVAVTSTATAAWLFWKPGMNGAPQANATAIPAAVAPTAAPSPAPLAATRQPKAPDTRKPVAPARTEKTALEADPALAIPAASIVQQRLEATRTWLKNQPPDNYTVQITLMEVGSNKQLERFLLKAESQLGNIELNVFPTMLGGIPRFGVTIGSYAGHTEARSVLNDLSNKWGYRPQIRSITRIRQEMEQTKSGHLWKL